MNVLVRVLQVLAALLFGASGVVKVFVRVHVTNREIGPIVMRAVLGLLMAFIAFGRAELVSLH